MNGFLKAGVALACLLGAGAVNATPVNGNGLVTPDVIYGSGNANGGFTGQTNNNIEVGLRAHQRYPAANIYNYNGINTYVFDSTVLTNPTNRSGFNFDWSVNVDQSGTSGAVLADFDYLFYWDTDKTTTTAYSVMDPFNTPGAYDHSLGTNATGNGGGIESISNANLLANMLNYNVAQQSWNLGFGFSTDPDAPGQYGFKFEVLGKGTQRVLSSAEILVTVTPVPLPAALPLAAAAFGMLGFVSHRRRDRRSVA